MNSFEFVLGGNIIETVLSSKEDGWSVTVDGTQFEVTRVDEHRYKVNTGNQDTIVTATYVRGIFYVDIEGTVYELNERPEDDYASSSDGSEAANEKVFAPMPGKIVSIMVSVGDTVAENQTLAIVEAMKMENPVQAKAAGTVKEINCAEGDQVDTEEVLIELEINLKNKK